MQTQKTTIKALVLNPGEPAKLVEIDRTLAAYQAIVGGYIEAVALKVTDEATAYINEEGKLDHRIEGNATATSLARLSPGDWIAGPMLILGPCDDEGNDTSVTPEIIAWAIAMPSDISLASERLEYLRTQIRGECISYGEIAELESLAIHIGPGDVELLEWAGVPEEEAFFVPCPECGNKRVDPDVVGADGRSVCDDCRDGTDGAGVGDEGLAQEALIEMGVAGKATPETPRKFRGTEIAYELVLALASLEEGTDIVELTAGENMEIKITLADEFDGKIHGFYTRSWNGASWGEGCPL